MVIQAPPPSMDKLNEVARGFGTEVLLNLPDGRTIDIASGFIPLLVNFTFEDKAAKGLRKRTAEDKPEPPIHFSALEVVRDNNILVINGSSGSGKTTFAKWLCWYLVHGGCERERPILRNEFGHLKNEQWTPSSIIPWYCDASSATFSFDEIHNFVLSLLDAFHGNLLIVLDNVGQGNPEARAKVASFLKQCVAQSSLRILVLNGSGDGNAGQVAYGQPRFDLMPLFVAQRRRALANLLGVEPSVVKTGIGEVAANTGIFALALQANSVGRDAEEVVDSWLGAIAEDDDLRRQICAICFEGLGRSDHEAAAAIGPTTAARALGSRQIAELCAARHLSQLAPESALICFRDGPDKWEYTIQSLLRRMGGTNIAQKLMTGLLSGSGQAAQRGALLVADGGDSLRQNHARVKALLLEVLHEGVLSIKKREKAGRILARLGDPRDLQRLVDVPAGSFIMGSKLFPNSQPVHNIGVEAFKISVFPVVNRYYARFVQETGRPWRSESANLPELLNAPATDLTWHDANAYCSWLTQHWRTTGSIDPAEVVRLPTEAEWEWAARGARVEDDIHDMTYPWGHEWQDDAANFEEVPFNKVCAVGLFPTSSSPYGCYDMAGNAWEWCSTLWGEDMAAPSYRYPYRPDDGREAVEAPESVRRVLRGGCFSSTRMKLSCSYRGSLEPAGSWRGNGFRIVVAKH